MLILVPIVILLVAAVVLVILQWVRPGFGLAWLLAVGLSLISWLLVVFLRIRLVKEVTLFKWQPTTLFSASPTLLMDRISWPFAFCLATLALAIVFTATARTIYQSNPITWAGNLVMVALGMFAVLSGNLLTLMIAWCAIDLTELVILMGNLSDDTKCRGAVIAFATRIAGIFMLLWAVIYGQGSGTIGSKAFEFSSLSSKSGLFLLLAAGLRLGIFPLHLPFSKELKMRRGMGTVLQLVPVASTLVLLARIPDAIISSRWVPYLSALTLITLLYGAFRWLLAEDELTGRPYWLISWAALAYLCVIRGDSSAGIAWGVAALLPGSLLFLFSARERHIYFIPILGAISLVGLPFMPTAAGWQGILGNRFSLTGFIAILSIAILILGYLHHAIQTGEEMTKVERWARVTYPMGLMLFVIADWVVGLWGWQGSRTIGVWWAGILTMVFVSIVTALYYYRPEILVRFRRVQNFNEILTRENIEKAFASVMIFFRLDWFYKSLAWTFTGTGKVLEGVTQIFEGDGGVLWALVVMSLLASLWITLR